MLLLTLTGCSCGYGLGDVACDFELTDQHGHQVRLSDYSGNIIIVDFSLAWCVTCKEALKKQNNLLNDLGGNDVTWLTILFQDKHGLEVSFEDCFVTAEQYNINQPVLVGDHNMINNAYLVTGWPSYYIINEDMVITEHIAGWYEDQIANSVVENRLK